MELGVLIAAAVWLGIIHTLLGPDHYVPFVALAKSQRWSLKKTLLITAGCGLGHVLSSVAIGSIGLALGTVLAHLQAIEASRGSMAAWLLIALGTVYTLWGLLRPGHGHDLASGQMLASGHPLAAAEMLPDNQDWAAASMASGAVALAAAGPGPEPGKNSPLPRNSSWPWFLFIIFVFGPCEVLIPLLMYPAATSNWVAVFCVSGTFSVATIATMLISVLCLSWGMQRMPMGQFHHLLHPVAGSVILLCGLLVKFGL